MASFVPALLVTILIFMDQQISAVIVNRKENKLKVECHLLGTLFFLIAMMNTADFLSSDPEKLLRTCRITMMQLLNVPAERYKGHVYIGSSYQQSK